MWSLPKISGGRIFKVDLVTSGATDQHTSVPGVIDDPPGAVRVGPAGHGIHDVHSERKPPAAYVAHLRVLGGHLAQRREQPSARVGDAGEDALLLDGPQYFDRCSAGSGATSEGAEVVGVGDEPVHEVRRAADGGDGVPVAHRLAQGHQISGHPASHEAPQVVPCAPVACLHLVCDVQSTGGMHEAGSLHGPVVGRPADPVAGENPVDQHGRHAVAGGVEALDRRRHRRRGGGRRLDQPDVRRRRLVTPALRRECDGRLRDTVVRPGRRDAARRARGMAGDPPRQVVGLGPRVHEKNPVEPRRERGQQPFGQLDGGLVQVAGVGVERGQLGADRVDDRGVRVPQHRDVVVGIEVAAPVCRLQEHASSTHEMQGMRVAELQPAQEVRACLEELRRGSSAGGESATKAGDVLGRARTGGGGEPGRQVVQAEVEHGLELAVCLVADGRRGALLLGPPGGDQDGRGVATRHQVGEELDLLRLQRRGRVIPRQDLLCELQTVVATAEDVGCRHCQVADQSRVGHVPEVGDAGDGQRVVDEHVGGGQVVVHDLRAHPEERRRDSLLEAVKHRLHRRALPFLDRREPWSQLREPTDVPG